MRKTLLIAALFLAACGPELTQEDPRTDARPELEIVVEAWCDLGCYVPSDCAERVEAEYRRAPEMEQFSWACVDALYTGGCPTEGSPAVCWVTAVRSAH
jgi:hypothetical protein